MASDLIRFDAFANEQDAMRALLARDYRPFDVFVLLDDVRQVAMQEIVAREMERP